VAAIIGVDPHKHVLSAVALDDRGGVLGNWNGAMSAKSLSTLLGWAGELTPAATWAIEDSNNLGRRLALALTSAGADVRDASDGPTTAISAPKGSGAPTPGHAMCGTRANRSRAYSSKPEPICRCSADSGRWEQRNCS
jgi:hypothetical protein